MRFVNQGLSLWYATPDAPAPEGAVPAGVAELVTVGLSPPDGSNWVDVHFRVNGGAVGTVSARWFRNDHAKGAQYFTARLPPFEAGDEIEFWATAACAGRYVPARDAAGTAVMRLRVGKSAIDVAVPQLAAWTPLSDRWASLPLVLAGPILRRVQRDLVTVWVVIKEHQDVTLLVFDPAGKTVLTGTRTTSRLGAGYHVVAVTARPSTEQTPRLRPGTVYSYNVAFGDFLHLRTPGVIAANYTRPGEPVSTLGYGSDDALPSFSLPPADPANLRIIHGSCRRAQGDDRDALEGLDEFLQSSATDPDHRPHHLVLTGDQIYGDNVAEALLYEIIQANATLFGVQEIIPGPNVSADQLHPGSRHVFLKQYGGLKAGYTFQRSHLLALSEYLSFYLYSWSDVLWPVRGNWIDHATARGGAGVPGVPVGRALWGATFGVSPTKEYDDTIQRLEYLRDGLPAVRRALANVPTYMTFDDHDFTDSWSITYQWTRSVLDSAFGARHMRNALTAYAICQGWGNRPDDYEPGQPGAALPEAVFDWITSGGQDLAADATLRGLIGPSEPQPLSDQTYMLVPPAPGSALRWDFVLDFPGSHRIISLDGRTHCGYPDDGQGYLAIIAPNALADQIPIEDDPPPITFVVSGAPVVGYGLLETGQLFFATVPVRAPARGNAEEWVYNLPAQQSLYARLAHTGATGMTLSGSPGRRSRVVMLSGDVHFGYTARLQYWAERPYGHSSASPVDMVLAQLTCSALKNERPATDAWHRDGYSAFPPEGPSVDRFKPGPRWVTEGVGWSNDSGENVQVGTRAQPLGLPDVALRIAGQNQVLFSSPDSDRAISGITVPPDYAFRAEWVVDPRYFTLDKPDEVPLQRLHWEAVGTALQSPFDATAAQELAALDAEIEARLARIAGASIIGRNQIGEITVTWQGGEPIAVTQVVWWRELRVGEEAVTGVVSPLLPLTKTTVSLAFDEAQRPFE